MLYICSFKCNKIKISILCSNMADIKSIWVPGTLLRDKMLIQEAGDDQEAHDQADYNSDETFDEGSDQDINTNVIVGGGPSDVPAVTADDLFKDIPLPGPVVTSDDFKSDDFESDKSDSTSEVGDLDSDLEKDQGTPKDVTPPDDDLKDASSADKILEPDSSRDSKDGPDIKSAVDVVKQLDATPLPHTGGYAIVNEGDLDDESLQGGAGWLDKNQPQFAPTPEVPQVPVLEQAKGNTADLFNILQSMFVSSNDNTVADLMEESAYDIHKIKSYLSEISKSMEVLATAAVKMSDKPKGNYPPNNNYQGNNNKMNSNN